jgi:RHS repeat-associated protein
VYWTTWNYSPLGNISDHDGTTYSYSDTAHKHAVTQMGTQYYCYDADGNMTKHNATSSSCTNGDTFTYNIENRLTQVVTSGGVTTNYMYDGDGNRIKKVVGSTTAYYVGNYYEVSGSATTKYYYFGGQRVAMKKGSTTYYLHTDHLGSTSVVADSSGALYSRQTYYAFGGVRTTQGSASPTDYGFTGQKLDASDGLMYYGARYYDPLFGRFTQPDTIVPGAGNPQNFNRYSYGLNNPVKYVDPRGYAPQYPGDDPNNPDPCGNDWCWQNRWYVAHGYHWSDSKQDWVLGGDPVFYDEAIIDEVLGEAGIRLATIDSSVWSFEEKTKVTTGIVKFGLALENGLEQLKLLLKGGATLDLVSNSPLYCDGGSIPCSPPGSVPPFTWNTVYIPKNWIDTFSLSWVAEITVHELAHLIDQHQNFAQRWAPYQPLTNYARAGGFREKWAEAVTVFVFGNDYQSIGRLLVDPRELQVQMDRIAALLNGWY